MKINKEHNGLGIPENYFSHLEKNILQEVETYELEKKLKSEFGDAHGFIVPEDYFEKFNPRSNGAKIFSLNHALRYGAVAAACIAVLFFSGIFDLGHNLADNDNSFEELLAQAEYSDLESLELFDTDELNEFIDPEEIESEDNLDEMLDYLLESEDDFDEITFDILEI